MRLISADVVHAPPPHAHVYVDKALLVFYAGSTQSMHISLESDVAAIEHAGCSTCDLVIGGVDH
jgi:hypothetical protein